ncbi:hypothetical protein JKP76_18950 [Blastococcus sp. TML/C7B]|uniref:hypothetical protein n=1 Tax=Blastococcus sp. TML/C7B TaxID=2798728 RepID=UPI00190D9FB2|nr:hypothetical protein [Blastococcus sp. TML/C7B]MBN1097909.1 hypothetical protein [Blastococcus sp. TML/C7B]
MTRAARRPSAAHVPSTTDRAFAAALVVLLPVWNGVLVGRVPSAAYVPVNLAASAVLLAVARWSGLSWAALGLSRHRVAAGLRWGGAAFGLVAVGLAVAVVVPVLRPLLADARAAGRDGADLSR